MTKGKLTVQAINERLKAAKIGVALRQKGSALYLRATLPPKLGETGGQQRDVALRIYANPAGLESSEAEARKLGALLACKELDWNLYQNPESLRTEGVTVAQWIERFKSHFFAARGHSPETEARWNKDYYGFVFKHLPPNANLTADLLVVAAQRPNANTRGRQYTCQILQQLANFAEIDVNLKPFSGNYSPRKVQPRNIPAVIVRDISIILY